MFAEELTKIREIEDRADKIREDAAVSSRKAVEDAEAEKERVIREAQSKAREIYDSLTKEGEESSEKEYARYISDVAKKNDDMIAAAEARSAEAVDLITERIVSIGGNR